MRINPIESVHLLGLNVQSGGFKEYDISEPPEREQAIVDFLAVQRNEGVSAATLTDTYGWREYYGADHVIASHTGFNQAWHQPLNDDRLNSLYGDTQVGITFATDHEVDYRESGPVRLENRDGLKTVLKLGSKTLHIISIYLDDLSDELREKQVKALFADALDPGERTIIIGDFNSPSPELHGAPISSRVKDLGFRAVSFAFEFVPDKRSATLDYYKEALTGMNHRHAMQLLEERGFTDADPHHQPTYRHGPLQLQLDHLMYRASNKPMAVTNFKVIPAPSDHDAIRATVDF